MGSWEIGRKLHKILRLEEVFLRMGVMTACLKNGDQIPLEREDKNIVCK